MKDKIMLFIIGVLVGAVVATGAFFVYSKTSTTNNNQQIQMPEGNPPSMPNGQPPEMPNSNSQSKE